MATRWLLWVKSRAASPAPRFLITRSNSSHGRSFRIEWNTLFCCRMTLISAPPAPLLVVGNRVESMACALYIEILRSGLKKRAGQPWAKAGDDETVTAGSRGEPAHVWRSLEQLVALRRLILKATIRRITWLRSECRDGKAG